MKTTGIMEGTEAEVHQKLLKSYTKSQKSIVVHKQINLIDTFSRKH